MGLVLGGNTDPADAGVDAVGERKIDDAKLAAERDRRLRPPVGQIFEPAAASTGKDESIGVLGDDADEPDIGIRQRRIGGVGFGRHGAWVAHSSCGVTWLVTRRKPLSFQARCSYNRALAGLVPLLPRTIMQTARAPAA